MSKSTRPVRRRAGKIPPKPPGPPDITPQLEAIAAWVMRAQAILCQLDADFSDLKDASEDPAHPLYRQVGFSGFWNVQDYGISPLASIALPGLSRVPTLSIRKDGAK